MILLSTSSAIILGFGLFGAFAGLGLYLGLRAQAPPAAAPAPSSIEPLAEAPASSAAVAAMVATTTTEAQHAIYAEHPHLVVKCWYPSFAANPLPASSNFTIHLDYAADGRLAIHRLQQDDAAFSRPDLVACMNAELVLPVVDPPGRRIRLPISIAFP